MVLATLPMPSPRAVVASQRSGLIFIGCGDDAIRILSNQIAVAHRIEQMRFPAAFPVAMAISEREGRVFVSCAGRTVLVLDSMTGRPLMTVTLEHDPGALVVCERANRVLSVDDGWETLSVFDSATGAYLKSMSIGRYLCCVGVSERTGRFFVVHEDDRGAVVTVIDAQRLAVVYSLALEQYSPSAVAVDDTTGHVFLVAGGGPAGNVSVLATGASSAATALITTGDVGAGASRIGISSATGRAFVGCEAVPQASRRFERNHRVAIIDTRTAALLLSHPLLAPPQATHTCGAVILSDTPAAPPQVIAVDQQTGRAFVACGASGQPGYVVALNATTGRQLFGLHAGEQAHDLVLDDQTGNLYVLNYSGNTVTILDGRLDASNDTTQ